MLHNTGCLLPKSASQISNFDALVLEYNWTVTTVQYQEELSYIIKDIAEGFCEHEMLNEYQSEAFLAFIICWSNSWS